MRATNNDPKTLYAVYWPNEGILKVGRASHMARVRRFNKTGARTMLLVGGIDYAGERAAHSALKRRFGPSFATPELSARLIPGTRGYTECYSVPSISLGFALSLVAMQSSPS